MHYITHFEGFQVLVNIYAEHRATTHVVFDTSQLFGVVDVGVCAWGEDGGV